ncbi:hypothetical protein [Spirulina subsalsa]|uniref:hypothetical protein n=1 Tax=Spirulina subsalsa TaxID=54311 RepID=UPI0003093E14|nr:hypothetical protein [Spirulina subsalsa]
MVNSALARLQGRSSAAKNPLKRLMHGDITQRFARFSSVRKTYSVMQSIRQYCSGELYPPELNIAECSVFDWSSLTKHMENMHRAGVSLGLQLPSQMVEEIQDYALHTPCREPNYHRDFYISEVHNGYLPDGHSVIRALVTDTPSKTCPAIAQLLSDPFLLTIVRNYLHYYPTEISWHLTWSIASPLPDEVIRQQYPPASFHYDIAGYNFMTAYFYITDVEADSGPHVMIRDSRRDKPLKMLISGGRQSDEAVLGYYGKDKEMVITGSRGFGFVQDPSCFHKVKPPKTSHRLLLQVRYS